jgi:hypothetical protein
MHRHSGVQEWQYVCRDGVIVSFASPVAAERLLEEMRAEMLAQNKLCHILAAHP